MKRPIVFLAAFLIAVAAFAQQAATPLTVMPSAGKAVGLVRATTAGRWFVLAADLSPIQSSAFKLSAEAGGGSLIFWEGVPGSRYTVLFVPDSSAESLSAVVVTLGGTSPNPTPGPGPTPPPVPPVPVTSAVKALILMESGNQTPAQAQLLNQLRNDKAWSKLVEKVDPQQKDQSNQPDPLAQAAVKACGSNPLPRVLLLDAAGSVVGDSLPLPGTFAELKSALTAKGIKP